MAAEVDYQIAARVEMRTPNWYRAKIAQPKSADGKMATEAARLKRKKTTGRKKTNLTLTGLLKEGLGQVRSANGRMGVILKRCPSPRLSIPARVSELLAQNNKSLRQG
jgi:hypothetical protein